MFPKTSSNLAIIQDEIKLTYKDLFEFIKKLSSTFSSKKNDNVVIFSENRYEWIIALYSIWNNFSTVIPVDYLSSPKELLYILNDAKPKYIFLSNKTLETYYNIKNELEFEIKPINFDEISIKNIETNNEINFDKIDYENIAVIPYTSGTTGNPKGVMLTFNNLWMNIKSVSVDIEIYKPLFKVIAILPFHHILPFQGTITIPLSTNETIVIASALSSDYLLNLMQKHKINLMIGVPRLYKLFYDGIISKINANPIAKTLFKLSYSIGSYKFGRKVFKTVQDKFGGELEYCVSGGAKLDIEVAKGMRALGFLILEGYGMTEAAPMISFPHPDKVKPGSAGFIMSCMEHKIIDGELIVKGPNVMKGYYNNPEATNQILKDGWLHTGDLAKIDKQGYVYIEGRSKDIIVLPNGKKFNPELIEFELIKNFPIIKEVGLSYFNDQLTAIIYPNENIIKEIGIVDVRDYIKWNVIDKYNKTTVDYKRINNFYVVNTELPKTRLGKIRRFALSDLVTKEKTENYKDVDIPEDIEYKILSDYLKSVVKKDILPDQHFEFDLGLDSLAKVELVSKIEASFEIKLNENALSEHSTLRKLSAFVKEKKQKLEDDFINWNKLLKEKRIQKLPDNTFLLKVLKYLSIPLFKTYFQLEIVGKENLPKTNCIIAPNHQSFIDGLLIACALNDNLLSKSYFFAKDKYIKYWFVKLFARFSNIISLNLNADLKESIQKMAYILENNKNIIIFPEGTRTRTGHMNDFKKSFAILSKELNVPIIPVTIDGAYEALSIGSKIPKPKKIKLYFLTPVYPENKSYDEIVEEVRFKIYKQLNK